MKVNSCHWKTFFILISCKAEIKGMFHYARSSKNLGQSQMENFGLLWLEYLWPPLEVFHFDWQTGQNKICQ